MTPPRSRPLAWLPLAALALACTPEDTPAPAPPPLPAVQAAPADPVACPDRDPLKRPFFGDTHVHTSFSIDAVGGGTDKLTPEDAIRFAKGEAIPFPLGGTQRLDRPLDFVAISDHAEFFHVMGICLRDPHNPGYDDEVCRALRKDPVVGMALLTEVYVSLEPAARFSRAEVDRGRELIWRQAQNAANDGHEPCEFTSFIGYEWTGGTFSGKLTRGNIHRNVIFASSTVPDTPFDARRWGHESELWRLLDEQCKQVAGCDVLSIPHNSVFGQNGSMWEVENPEQARMRAEMDRLVELYQHKGNSECANHNLDPEDGGYDRACRFEEITFDNIFDAGLGAGLGDGRDSRPNMVRTALAKGLGMDADGGLNPFRFGLIASTDTHIGAAGAVAEARYRGHVGNRGESDDRGRLIGAAEHSPGGLAVLWAEQNTRRALFDAMLRREAYATSGPRIELRFYASGMSGIACGDPGFPQTVVDRDDHVPMGGVYPGNGDSGDGDDGSATTTAPPVFAVHAKADHIPLERLEIVRVRQGSGTAGAPDEYANSEVIELVTAPKGGAETLCAEWQDPHHDPTVPTAYYVRALETPSPRWTYFACLREPDLCENPADEMIRERAWSSPIWVGGKK